MTLRTATRIVLAVLATAGFAAILYYNFDLPAIRSLLLGSDPRWLAGGAIASITTTLLRASRLSLVVAGGASPPLMAASIVHNATTALLPMKLGEFALPLLLARVGDMRLTEGLGVLLVVRVLDMLALLLVGSLAAWIALARMPQHAPWASMALALSVATVLGVLVMLAGWKTVASGLRDSRLLQRVPFVRRALMAATMASPAHLAAAFGLSLAIWACLFLAFYCFWHAIGLDVDVAQAATIGTAASFAFAFPISGVANVGPFQAAWTWMALQFDLPATASLAASLVSHGGVVIVTAALAAIASPLILRQRHLPGNGSERPG